MYDFIDQRVLQSTSFVQANSLPQRNSKRSYKLIFLLFVRMKREAC
jgi:hypothetical protein